jgi:hypothetical protein
MSRVAVTRHRTIGAHVSEALWQTVCYLAATDEMSVSDLTRVALMDYLESRGVPIATYEQIVGQAEIQLERMV